MATEDREDPKKIRNGRSGFSKCQVVLLIVGAQALAKVLEKGFELSKQSEVKEAAVITAAIETTSAVAIENKEWPPGGVDWETGEDVAERAMNKNPPREDETVSNKPQPFLSNNATFNESKLFHKWLDGLHGIEIGSSAHNGFGLDTLNVDFTSDKTVFAEEQIRHTGVYRRVDIISPGNRLPFPPSSVDFVVSSHAVEHFHDPIGFMCEAARVVKSGGYIASILPLHGAHPPDKERNRTLLSDLIYRHHHPIDPLLDDHHHWQVWMAEDMIEMCRYMNLNVVAWQEKDDKVGNGFSVIVLVPENKFDINC